MIPTVKCPSCGGAGRIFGAFKPVSYECRLCHGRGEITINTYAQFQRGEALKQMRRKAGFSLRKTAARLGVSMMTLSRAEQGIDSPEEFIEQLSTSESFQEEV